MIRLEDAVLVVGTRTLLDGASWHLRPGERVGLVGRNGAGKTTLLRALIGDLELASGTVHRRSGVQLGYLPQQAVSGSTRTVWDEAGQGMTRLNALEADVARLEAAVAAQEEGAIAKHADAVERFRLAGGYAKDERVGEVLHGLGFSPDDWTRSCDTFSGGWQMRIALARMLLSDPDVLLLDEPTNHLDLAARTWLARYLAGASATQVIVSHDRHLLDKVCTTTVEVRHKQLERFSGGLSAWLAERALRDEQRLATRRKQLDEVAKLERFVERFGAKATKAAQAQSRKKQLEKIEVVDAPVEARGPRLALPEAPGCARDVITLRDVSVGWDDTPVVTGVDWVVQRGERWAILGPNGAGKSTLLHAVGGRMPLLGGKRTIGKDVRMATYAQDLAQELPADRSALDVVLSMAPAITTQQGRTALGALGLSGDMALRPIGSLSGGEKARVVLAGLSRKSTNVLLLDEPTNHLDVLTVDALAEALAAYEGAVLLVTHDRWLVERLATHVAVVSDGGFEAHEGVRPEDLEPVPASAEVGAGSTPSAGKQDHEARKAARRIRQRLKKLEATLDKLSATIDALDAELFDVAGDHEKAAALGERRAAASAEMEAVFEEMTELEATLDDDA